MKATTPKLASGSCWQLWLDGKEDLLSVWNLPPSSQGIHQHNEQRRAIDVEDVERGFYGASEQEARAVITNGWPKGAKIVESLAASIAEELPPPKSRRRTRKWSDDGDEVSYERMQLGQEPWLSSHRKLKSACGLVEVIQSWGLNCGARQDHLQWSGAAALALTDLLEKADYSVELALVGGMALGNPKGTIDTAMIRVDLKRMGELLDLEQLAAIAIYPPAWRIYGLCAFQLGPVDSGAEFCSHPHADAQEYEPNGMWNYRPNVMTLSLNECHNEERAKETVLSALKQLESLVNPQEASDQ